MTIEELLSINTTTPVLDTAIVYAFMENKPAPAYDPFTDSSYTQLTDTELYELTFYVYDHLGNTRVTYEPKFENGIIEYAIKGVFDYYPYGKTLRFYNPEEEKYLTTQHQRDTETGFDYRGARFYDADIARFLSVDPLADKYAQWSTYNYVMSNPLLLVDPTGKGPGPEVTKGYILEGFRLYFKAAADIIDNFKAEVTETLTFNKVENKVGPITVTRASETQTKTAVSSNLSNFLDRTPNNSTGPGSFVKVTTTTTTSQVTSVKTSTTLKGVDVTVSNKTKVDLSNGAASNSTEVVAGKGSSGVYVNSTTNESGTTNQVGVKVETTKNTSSKTSISIGAKLFYQF